MHYLMCFAINPKRDRINKIFFKISIIWKFEFILYAILKLIVCWFASCGKITDAKEFNETKNNVCR
jgi:hypothetical protein